MGGKIIKGKGICGGPYICIRLLYSGFKEIEQKDSPIFVNSEAEKLYKQNTQLLAIIKMFKSLVAISSAEKSLINLLSQ